MRTLEVVADKQLRFQGACGGVRGLASQQVPHSALLHRYAAALSGAQVHLVLCCPGDSIRPLLYAGRCKNAGACAGAVVSSGDCLWAMRARLWC